MPFYVVISTGSHGKSEETSSMCLGMLGENHSQRNSGSSVPGESAADASWSCVKFSLTWSHNVILDIIKLSI